MKLFHFHHVFIDMCISKTNINALINKVFLNCKFSYLTDCIFTCCLHGEHLHKELYLNDQNIRNIVYCTLPHLVFLRQ